MQLYKFWTRGNSPGNSNVSCLGYSNISLQDALRVAQKRAGDVARRIADGTIGKNDYYPDSPIREEIIDEFFDEDSGEKQIVAAITRNSYGCLVLNTPQVFFADVDNDDHDSGSNSGTQPKQPGIFQALQGIFGKSKALENIQDFVDKAQDLVKPEGTDLATTIQQIVAEDSTLLIRLYRTMIGFRVMIVSELIPATQPQASEMLVRLGADKLYASLCKTQDCCRARLTPKPWRIDYTRPPFRFPFDSKTDESRLQDWVSEYDSLSEKFATCHLVGEFGSAAPHPIAQNVVALHDHYTLNGEQTLG